MCEVKIWFDWAKEHLASWRNRDGQFTPGALQIFALARRESERLNHNFLGTEHLLLGILKLGRGVAVNIIKRKCGDLETVRMEVEKHCPTSPPQKPADNIPYTPRANKVIAEALSEAGALNHTHIGTEHLLLGILKEGDGLAARVLLSHKLTLDLARQEVLKELDPKINPESPGQGNPPTST